MKTAILILSMFSFSALFSQTTIQGTVSDQNGDALIAANVYLKGTYDGTSSDENGAFEFTSEEKGAQTLVIEFLGYEALEQEILLEEKTIALQARLKQVFNELKAVTITSGAFEASDKKKTVVLTSLDMITTAGASGDVTGALQTLPGTTTVGESGRLFVRGGDSRETKTYIDGALVHAPYTTTPPQTAVRGRFNPFLFKGTIFSTGGYSAEYGQALSSVLLLDTKDIQDQDQIDFSIMSLGLDAAATKKWENGAVTATASYINLSPYLSFTPQNLDWDRAPNSISGAVSFRQKTSKSGLFKLYTTYDRSKSTINYLNLNQASSKVPYTLKNNYGYVNATWKDVLGEKWALKSSFSYTDNSDLATVDNRSSDNQLNGAHVKNVFTFFPNPKTTLKFGAEIFTDRLDQTLTDDSGSLRDAFKQNRYVAFTEADLYTSTKFVARVGARLEYSDYLDRANWSPRLSAAYRVSDESQFSASYGWFYQDPADRFLRYDDQLSYERADHVIVNFQSTQKNRTFRVETYYKKYRDLVKSVSDQNVYGNGGDGYAYGLDLFWRDKASIKNGQYWISYSYIDTKRNYLNYPEEAIPGFTSKHNLSVVYKHWFSSLKSLVGGTFSYSSPRRYNDPNTTIFNGAKTPSYRSVNVNWSYLYRQHVIFYAAVTNLPGFKNEFGYQYAPEPNSNGVYEGNKIVPFADRFFFLGCFVTLSRRGDKNQLDKIQ